MPICIATDSTCDLPANVIKQYGIAIIPCYINFGEKSYLDNVEMTRSDFYAHLNNLNPFPKTSAPGMGQFIKFYDDLAHSGFTKIISIHIHTGLSAMANAARLAAEAVKTAQVTVIEIGQVALTLGFLVAGAARAARQSKSVDEIVSLLHEKDKRTYLFAALDTLEFLKHSGRVPSLVADLADILKIKPVLQLHLGVISMDKIRTASQSLEWLIERVKRFGALEELGMVHTHASEKARAFLEKVKESLVFKGEIWIEEATPVLGVHVGPGAVGLACVVANHD